VTVHAQASQWLNVFVNIRNPMPAMPVSNAEVTNKPLLTAAFFKAYKSNGLTAVLLGLASSAVVGLH